MILLFGIAIFFGTVAARVIQRFRTPQIIGFILIGVVLEPTADEMIPKMPLSEALARMHELDVEQLPVVTGAEVLAKQKEADSMARIATG